MKLDIYAAQAAAIKKPLYKSLFFQIFVAVVAGILIGYLWPSIGAGWLSK